MNELYNENGLSIQFDSDRVGYWINVGEIPHFVDDRAFEDFKSSEGFDLLKKINAYDDRIIRNLPGEDLGLKDLEKAILEVGKIEEKAFQGFLKTNGL